VQGPEVAVDWTLTSDGDAWRFTSPSDGPPAARLQMSTDQAWRLLSNNLDVDLHGAPTASGDSEIVAVLLRTRAIIGTPK
jgi:hypothetical protein